MDVANLNPMVSPNSGGIPNEPGSNVLYIIIVLVILILLVVVGYFAMRSDGHPEGVTVTKEAVFFTEEAAEEARLNRLKEQAYIAYQTERGNPPELNEDGSLVSDIITPSGPDIEPETIRISDEGSMIENYIIMPDNIDYEYQTYAYNPKDTSLNGSAITFDRETNKCPDGTLDCLYYTRVEDGRVTSITDKDGIELIEKFTEDLWNGRLELLETPESREMMKEYELNEKRQLMRDGKVLKPGVDLNVGQYLLIFSIMYRVGAAAPPKIIYDFSPKITNIPITEILPDTPDDATEDVSSVEKEMEDLESEVEQTETPTLNDISAKITFVSPSPSVEQETPTLDNVQTQVELVTPTLGNIRERVNLEEEKPVVTMTSTLGDIRERVAL
tara:strand:- start:761 stop:1921 length:1161 start_codon:yes stop_codon:yes gene_type:complete